VSQGSHYTKVTSEQGFAVGTYSDSNMVIDEHGVLHVKDGYLPLSAASEDPDAPSEGVVIWFDGTDVKAKNADGGEATLNSSAFA